MTSSPYSEALGATLIERAFRERIVLVGVAFQESPTRRPKPASTSWPR
jgi:hypothetical protein